MTTMIKGSKGIKPMCFVPNCPSTAEIGVRFPRTASAKEKWLQSLGLTDKEPRPDSLICIDHFEGGVTKSVPVPIISGKKENAETVNTKRKITKSSKQDAYKNSGKSKTEKDEETAKSKLENTNYEANENARSRPRTRSTRALKSDYLTEAEIDRELKKLFESENYKEDRDWEDDDESDPKQLKWSEEYRKKDGQELKETDDIMNRCRLCTEAKGNLESIYDNIDEKHTIIHAMIVCIFPLRITPTDKLSKKICKKCLKILKDFFKFRLFCLEMDSKQQPHRGIQIDYVSEDSDLGDEDCDWEEEFELPVINSENSTKAMQSEEDLLQVLGDGSSKKSTNQKQSKRKTRNLSEIIQSQLEKETNVQEGEETFENITIDVVEDETGDMNCYKLSSSNLPIIIKPISSAKNPDPIPPFEKKIRTKSKSQKRKWNDNDDVSATIKKDPLALPKEIRVVKLPTVAVHEVPEIYASFGPERDPEMAALAKAAADSELANKNLEVALEQVEKEREYYSNMGMTEGGVICYLMNSEFFAADDYLYVFWLSKKGGRSLYCLSPECPAEAYQTRTKDNTFRNEIDLIVPHNHEPFSDDENKKLMFYHVLRKNMSKQQNYNFKTLYDKLVALDPSVVSLLPPPSRIIDGLCKNCPVPEIPKFTTFNEFFDLIEEKCFSKIHFLPSGDQFYQEWIKCPDGSKAVIFANQKRVELCSSSKVMYVDASFQVIKDIFPYQLVTVIVLLNDIPYPIVYAFVNQHSEEVYKGIFEYLYNTLGPNLRPDEIITEYDADVYYALAQTYVNSRVGGSYLSFCQTIYKVTCALDLDQELESNLSFRSFYYMLLMLPLLPASTITSAFRNVERHVEEGGLTSKMQPMLSVYHDEWLEKVTPEFFSVHRNGNRTFNNLTAVFRKLKNATVTSKTKPTHPAMIVTILEKIVELESFVNTIQQKVTKEWTRDTNVSQKKMVIKAWNDMDENPKIKLLDFQLKVLGFLKCMENQLWIWGCYGVEGPIELNLINAANFTLPQNYQNTEVEELEEEVETQEVLFTNATEEEIVGNDVIVEEFVVQEDGQTNLENVVVEEVQDGADM